MIYFKKNNHSTVESHCKIKNNTAAASPMLNSRTDGNCYMPISHEMFNRKRKKKMADQELHIGGEDLKR